MPQGRKPKGQEFLAMLHETTGLSQAEFAKACGKQGANMQQYLSGALKPGKLALKTAVESLRDGWPVTPKKEVEKIPDSLADLPSDGGTYALYSSAGDVLYVGQAKNLRAEVSQALNRKVNFAVRRGPRIAKKEKPRYKDLAKYMSAYVVKPPKLRHNLEALLLRVFPNHAHNNKMGNFQD